MAPPSIKAWTMGGDAFFFDPFGPIIIFEGKIPQPYPIPIRKGVESGSVFKRAQKKTEMEQMCEFMPVKLSQAANISCGSNIHESG